jgi:hypothetical protein
VTPGFVNDGSPIVIGRRSRLPLDYDQCGWRDRVIITSSNRILCRAAARP